VLNPKYIGRLITIIGHWLESAHEIAEEQLSDDSYTSPEDFLEEHTRNQEDIAAMTELRQHLLEENRE